MGGTSFRIFNTVWDVVSTTGGILIGVVILAGFLWFLNRMGFTKIKLSRNAIDLEKPDPSASLPAVPGETSKLSPLKLTDTNELLITGQYRTTHLTCSLSEDIYGIDKLVRQSSWSAMDVLRMETRAKQMEAIDNALDTYKDTLEKEYLAHLKRSRGKSLLIEEYENAKLVYHIMSDSLIRKIMNELRKFISKYSPFDPESSEVKWAANRTRLIEGIFNVIKTELNDYFPRQYMVDCDEPAEFLTEFRRDVLRGILEETLDQCRVFSLNGKQKYEKILDDMDEDVMEYVRGHGDCDIDAEIEREFAEGLRKASRSI